MTVKKILRIKKQVCMTCDNTLLSQESKLKGKCSFCRLYPEIKKRRMEEWNSLMNNANMITDSYTKRYVIMNLLKNKSSYEKTGTLGARE